MSNKENKIEKIKKYSISISLNGVVIKAKNKQETLSKAIESELKENNVSIERVKVNDMLYKKINRIRGLSHTLQELSFSRSFNLHEEILETAGEIIKLILNQREKRLK